jgi:hypothetical protein
VHAICIHLSHAGELRLEFPWRVLDSIQGLPSGMPVIIISPHLGKLFWKNQKREEKGVIWIGATH